MCKRDVYGRFFFGFRNHTDNSFNINRMLNRRVDTDIWKQGLKKDR